MNGAPECPSDGTLRAYLDNAADSGAQTTIEAHLQTCTACRERLVALRSDADLVSGMLEASAPPDVDAGAAWEAFRSKEELHSTDSRLRRIRDMFATADRARRRALATAGAIALMGALVLVPPLRTAAGQFLDAFRVSQIQVVTFDPDEAVSLQQELFSRVVMDEPQPRDVADAQEAAALLGMPVLTTDTVPDGFSLSQFTVTDARSARAWVDLEAARSFLELAGLPTDVLPNNPDDNVISAYIPPVAMQRYRSSDGSFDVVQLASPVVSVPEGMDVERLGQLGLQLLGYPEEQASSMARSINWATTLVVPVPTDVGSAQEVTVQGVNGYVLENHEDEEYTENSVVWEKDDVVYALIGSLESDQLLAVAQSLR